MSTISITELYDFLCTKFGKETAKNFVNFIEAKMNTDLENKTQILATKDDISLVNSRIEQATLKIEQTKSELALKISESKSETTRWMFIFWIGQIAATFGLILLFLKR